MKTYARVPWVTAVLAAALLAASATAADPKDKDAKDKEAPAKVDKDVEAWINVLTAKIADRHDTIRESARLALIALGKPALPALQKLVDGADGAAAEAAQHVIAHIEHGPGHEGPFGPHGFRGEMGPHHIGFPMGGPPPHPGAGGPPSPGPHPGGPPGHSGGVGSGGFDPNMIFNLLSNGKDYIVVSEMLTNPMASARDPDAKERVESFMKRHGITNGQLSREQFAEYMQERMTERRAAREAANPGGPQPGAGPGAPRPGGAVGGGGAAAPGRPGPRGLGGPDGPGVPGLQRAMQDLNLTDAQKTKVQEVIKAQGEKTREAMQKLHEDFLNAIKGAIGEEEFKKLEKNLPKPPAPGDLPGLSGRPKPPKE